MYVSECVCVRARGHHLVVAAVHDCTRTLHARHRSIVPENVQGKARNRHPAAQRHPEGAFNPALHNHAGARRRTVHFARERAPSTGAARGLHAPRQPHCALGRQVQCRPRADRAPPDHDLRCRDGLGDHEVSPGRFDGTEASALAGSIALQRAAQDAGMSQCTDGACDAVEALDVAG